MISISHLPQDVEFPHLCLSYSGSQIIFGDFDRFTEIELFPLFPRKFTNQMVPKLKGDFTVRVSRVRQDQIEGPLLDGRRLSWEVFIGIARDIQ